MGLPGEATRDAPDAERNGDTRIPAFLGRIPQPDERGPARLTMTDRKSVVPPGTAHR